MKVPALILLVFLLVNTGSGIGAGFEVDRQILKFTIKQGEEITDSIKVVNLGRKSDFEIEYFAEKSFFYIDEEKFELDKNEEKKIRVNFNTAGLSTGIYIGKIVIFSEETREIPVILEIESEEVSFDSILGIEQTPLNKNIVAKIKIANLKSSTGNANLRLFIKSLDGEIIIEEIKELNIKSQIELVKDYALPSEGNFIFGVEVREGSSLGASTALISFKDISLSAPQEDKNYLIASLFVVLVLIFVFLIFNYYWNRRVLETARNWKKEVKDLKKIKLGDINKEISKLEYKKSVLRKAYEMKYITKGSYEEGVKKINEIVNKLKKRL